MAPKAKPKGIALPSLAKAKSVSKSKSAAAPKAKGKAANYQSKVAPKELTPEDRAAIKLQVLARGFISRRRLKRLKEEKKKYDEEMERAEREAMIAAQKAERKREEAKAAKEAEKRRKIKELAEKTKKMLAAAFDGEDKEVKKLLDSVPVDAADPKGITALSEAAASLDGLPCIKVLLEAKANPNSRGEFKRTPLWRAAYSSQAEAVNLLLEAGSDPRLPDEQGQCPVDIATNDPIVEKLRGWDTSKTDELVEDYQDWVEEQQLLQQQQQAQAMGAVNAEYEEAKKAHLAAQKTLAHAKQELRKRIVEYDTCKGEGKSDEIMQFADAACKKAEETLLQAENTASTAKTRFDKANAARLDAAESCGADSGTGLGGITIKVMQLNDILLQDTTQKICKGDKWPLVIDPSDRAGMFLKYAGCAVLNFWNAKEIAPELLRVALLSMIRGGGILAINLLSIGAVDREMLSAPFEAVREGLFDKLWNRTLLTQKDKGIPLYMDLVDKKKDGKNFESTTFNPPVVQKFKLCVLTSSNPPHEDLVKGMMVIEVKEGS